MTAAPTPAPSPPLPPYPRIDRAAQWSVRAARRGLRLARWPSALLLALAVAAWPASPPRTPWSEGLSRSYAPALTPMISRAWDALGLSGHGVRVGVIDAGFGGWREDPMLQGLQVEREVDFIGAAPGWEPDPRAPDPMRGHDLSRDAADHGTHVLRALAGRRSDSVEGLAHGARFLLVKTDHAETETRADEARTIAALRWLVRQDVDVINVSLGYIGFEDAESYRREQLDGRSARISAALTELLAAHPDLVVVLSAGNRGTGEWRHIGFPGDVADALTVGAVDPASGRRWSGSGTGPPWLPAPKPDVATWGTRGTSFTAPAVAGLVACLREAAPGLSRREVLRLIRSSASQAGRPDREMGYGIVQTDVLLQGLAALRTPQAARNAASR